MKKCKHCGSKLKKEKKCIDCGGRSNGFLRCDRCEAIRAHGGPKCDKCGKHSSTVAKRFPAPCYDPPAVCDSCAPTVYAGWHGLR